MDRKLVFTGMFVALMMAASPLASAQTETPYGTTSGDPAVLEDGAKCFDAVAGTDETCVVLYGHVFDLLNRVPINVQRPPLGAPDLSSGFTSTAGYEDIWDLNQLDLVSSPGFVEYADGPDDDPRIHPERGLSFDVLLSDTVPITGYWYLSADFDEFSVGGIDHIPPGSGEDPSIGIMPCLEVRMAIMTNNHYGNGDLVAEGSVTKHVVTASALEDQEAPEGLETPCPNQSGDPAVVETGDVIEFEIDMGVAQRDIPRIQGFVIRAEWFLYAPSGDPDEKDKIYQREWNLHTGDDYMPRVLIPLKNPVSVDKVRPQLFDGDIYIHGVFNSPWGSYDVDHGTIKTEIFDESGAPVEATLGKPLLRYSVDHNGHFKPVNATVPWEYQKDNLKPGTYTVRMTAENWQHTGTSTKEGTIILAEDIQKSVATDSEGNSLVGDSELNVQNEESPLVGMPAFVLLALAALALVRRRR